jgi:hypothetical protein
MRAPAPDPNDMQDVPSTFVPLFGPLSHMMKFSMRHGPCATQKAANQDDGRRDAMARNSSPILLLATNYSQ